MGIYINKSYVNHKTTNFQTASRGPKDISWIVVHYTANPGSTAIANCQYYGTANTNGVSAHYFVDKTGIYSCVEERNIAGHCGKYVNSVYLTECRNSNSIGIEMCCHSMSGMKASQLTGSENDLYIDDETEKLTIDLIRDLMSRYGIPIDHVIRHYDVHSGRKPCPRPFVGDDINKHYGISGNSKWIEFRNKIMNYTSQPHTPVEPASTKTYPKTPFPVNVKIPDLNYRSLPSMEGKVNGVTGVGIYTITKVENDWGKLLSGAGWIYLGNPNYVDIISYSGPFPVRVDIDDLNIRTGPGVGYTTIGMYTGRGTFTITEETDGRINNNGDIGKWGLLKSGAGWICLSVDGVTKI